MTRSATFSVRVTQDEKKHLEEMAESTGVPLSVIAHRCLLGALDFWQEHKHLPMPPVLLPADSLEYKKAIQRRQDAAERAKLDQMHQKSDADRPTGS